MQCLNKRSTAEKRLKTLRHLGRIGIKSVRLAQLARVSGLQNLRVGSSNLSADSKKLIFVIKLMAKFMEVYT